MVIDDEVLAVLTAIVTVACALGIALSLPRSPEPFTAIGLLNEQGKIGDYPRVLVAGEPVRLQVFVMNHLGKAAMLKVEAKIGARGRIPSNSTPLDALPARYLRGRTYRELEEALERLGYRCRVWAHNERVLRIGLDKHGMLTCMRSCEAVR